MLADAENESHGMTDFGRSGLPSKQSRPRRTKWNLGDLEAENRQLQAFAQMAFDPCRAFGSFPAPPIAARKGQPSRRPHRTAIAAPNQILPSSLAVKCEAISPFALAPRTGKRVRIAENLRSGFDLDADLDQFVDDINFHGDW
jgi:hypothetical protein